MFKLPASHIMLCQSSVGLPLVIIICIIIVGVSMNHRTQLLRADILLLMIDTGTKSSVNSSPPH